MTKALTTTLMILAITLAVFFYGSVRSSELAQISDVIVEDAQPNLLPISQFQASAHNNFLRFFGPASPAGGGEKAQIDFGLVEPVAGFKKNITKKPFGIFITPENSPVENDKFNGYHTGVDSEFTDSPALSAGRQEEIPILAIADGTIIVRTWSSGYGGVVVIKHIIEGVPLFALYGHLDPASFLPPGTTQVKAGDQIGVLGDDHSEETDGARKHLHFSIFQDRGDKQIDFRGYVKTKEELSGWLNPLDLY